MEYFNFQSYIQLDLPVDALLVVDGPDDDHGDGGAHLPDLTCPLRAAPLLLLLIRLLQFLKVLQALHVGRWLKVHCNFSSE